jgi:DNA-binding transcriptional LysR family regulator
LAVKLQQLRYFVGVAEEGQMTRAAQSLHVAQPALSHAIAHLEAQLGVDLLERHPRGVSLTVAGETFFTKARLALDAAAEAELTAESLTRAARNLVELGFLGSPPMLDCPELFTELALLHPELEIGYRELAFPSRPAARWLEEVDLVVCFSPPADAGLETQLLRSEQRSLLLADTHPLARCSQLTVAEVLDETFPGRHRSADPGWAGLWRLDDHRGAPAPNVTADEATRPQEIAAIVASGRAVTVAAASNARELARAMTGLTAIPLRDAEPVTLSLAWHGDDRNPRVAEIVQAAGAVADGMTACPGEDGPLRSTQSIPTAQNGIGHALRAAG